MGDNEIELELVKEFERLVQEGGIDATGNIILEDRYNCSKGFHKWKLYVGFTNKYHYCELCDLKDNTRRF